MSPRSWLAPTLLTVMTLAVIDAARLSGPLIDAAFTQSTVTAATAALLTYGAVAVPIAVLSFAARGGRLLRATGISVVLYVIARAAMQLFPDGLYPAALAVTTIALTAWVLCLVTVIYAFSPRQVVGALLAGVALSGASQLILGTWDLAWRTDLLALVLITFGLMGLFLLGAFAITKQAAGPDLTPSHVRLRHIWPFGLWLALALMVFANPAFLASQSGFSLGWSGAFLIGVCAVGISLLSPETPAAGPSIAPVQSGWQRTLAALIGCAGGIAGAFILSGVASFIGALLALLCTIPLLLDVLTPQRGALDTPIDLAAEIPRPGPGLLIVGGFLIGLGTVVPVLLYQLDYDIPLPIANHFIPILAAAGIGVAALIAILRHPSRAAAVSSAADTDNAAAGVSPVTLEKPGGGALLLVALFAGLMAPAIPDKSGASEAAADQDQVRVVSWNLHYGVSAAPRVALDDILATISDQDPDVVLLQEVSRGWILGGGADMLTWLAAGLDMDVAWAPAADGQFGNAVLSKWPLSDESAYRLPYGAGPQNRSFISATVAHPSGEVRVTSTHLQHRSGVENTRLEQVDALLEHVSATENSGATILGGDFNAVPDSLEISQITDAGWLSTLDAAGNGKQNTHPSNAPATRIDWLFSGTQLDLVSAEVLKDTQASDHLPLVATFELGD